MSKASHFSEPFDKPDFLAVLKERYPAPLHPILEWGEGDEILEDESFYEEFAKSLRGQTAALTRLVLDRELHWDGEEEELDQKYRDIPALWAPYHGLLLLQQLASEVDIVPLLELFEWGEEALIPHFAVLCEKVGERCVPILWDFVDDRARNANDRALVARILAGIGEEYPALKPGITDAMLARLSRPERDESNDEEIVNAGLIMSLCDLHAETARRADDPEQDPVYQAILRAFQEDIVSDVAIMLEDVQIEFGLRGTWTDEEREERVRRHRAALICDACGRLRFYDIPKLYFDPEGLDDPDMEEWQHFFIPASLSCPKCGARDQWSPSGQLVDEVFQEVERCLHLYERGQMPSKHPYIKLVRFSQTPFGQHPRMAEPALQADVAARPDDFEALRKLGFLMMFSRRFEEAIPLLGRAHDLHPRHAQVVFFLAQCFEKIESYEDAIKHWRLARDLAKKDRSLAPQEKRMILDMATDRLRIVSDVSATQPSSPKLKPNAPCPCGSGKKYKKCCMK